MLYKDARVDMNILDETFGAENWQRDHFECKGNLFCKIGVRYKPDSNEWIWKADCGTESNAEAEKGEASDSFKRAGTNVGIGRELYTAPFIWVSSDKCDIKPNEYAKGKNDKFKCKDNFSVQSIKIENKTITALTIYNEKKKCVAFTFGKSAPSTPPKEQPKEIETIEDARTEQNDKDPALINIQRRRLDEKVQTLMAIYSQSEAAVKKMLGKNANVAKAETLTDYKKLCAAADDLLNK